MREWGPYDHIRRIDDICQRNNVVEATDKPYRVIQVLKKKELGERFMRDTRRDKRIAFADKMTQSLSDAAKELGLRITYIIEDRE